LKTVQTPTYRVYYMDNDRQKRVIGTGLLYTSAIKLSQQMFAKGISCELELGEI